MKAPPRTKATPEDFLLRLARALHTYGYPAPRLEEVLDAASAKLGVRAQFFSTPTSIFAAFGEDADQRTYLLRVEPGDTDLSKLSDLYDVTRDVLNDRCDAAEGSERIGRLAARSEGYGPAITVAGFGGASGAAGLFLGGGLAEILVATLVGVVVGGLATVLPRQRGVAQLFEPVAAFVASVVVVIAAQTFGGVSVFIATIAGLIVLVPGLTVTIAMRELASRHLVAGTARLAGAFVVFVGMAFGVAVGNQLASRVFGAVTGADPMPLPGWAAAVALPVAGAGFAVLLKAKPRDIGWIILAGSVAFVLGVTAADLLGPELGVFVGALGVGSVANLFARWRDRPSAIMSVPGILLLVPGSVGFRGVVSMLDQEVVAGVEAAFTMVLMAVSLAAGLLIANVIMPPGGSR